MRLPKIATNDFRAALIVPSVIAGLVGGMLAVTFMFSYSAVIFSGELAQFVPRSTGQLLFGGFIIGLVMALFSQLKGVVALPQDNPTAILAVMIASISEVSRVGLVPEALFLQAVIIMALSTAAAGVLFYLIGRFKLAALVQYIPYPVIAGFLAGTGWLLVKGSFGVMAGVSFDFSNLAPLIDAIMLWGPGAVFAVVVLWASMRFTNVFVMPALILGAVVLFHLVLLVSGTAVESAIAQGWLLEPFGDGGLWKPLDLTAIAAADWGALLTNMSGIGTILIIAIISVLLNLTALQSAFGQDIDLDRELKTVGLANLLAAPTGSLMGYHYVSLSTLGRRMKGDSRLVGVVVATVCLLAMTVGADLLSFVPRLVLGGLVMFIGLGFLNDWVVQSYGKLSRSDMVIIVAIVIVVETVGFLEGVASGIAIAAVLFIVNYSRTGAIRYAFTGKELHSNIERPTEHRDALRAQGDRILYLKLQGYIFFATSTGLSRHIDGILSDPANKVSFVILDFQQVQGVDTSAIHEFVKIKNKAAEVGGQLALTHMQENVRLQFHRERFSEGNAVIEPSFADADHALEWCEDFILRETGFEPSFGYKPLDDQLREIFSDARERAAFTSALVAADITKGSLLLRPDEHEPRLYFIEDGELTIVANHGDDEAYRLGRVGPGALIGIAGFFGKSPQGSPISARAESDGRAHYLTKQAYLELISEHPQLAAELQAHVLGVLSERYASDLGVMEILLRAEE